tara:strand:+ start:169 stop:1293 length:1125 start_codon:yes stop_codon:yes gene_type:complete
MTNKRILFVITEDWALISHRLHLVEAAINAGYEVAIATKINKHRKALEDLGVKVFAWKLHRGSLNPIKEIIAIFSLCKILSLFKPHIIHAVAQKPVIYAGLARKIYNQTSFVGTLGGVGFVFTSKSFKAAILKPLLKFLLKFALVGKKTRLILQNKDNVKTIERINIIDKKYIRLVKGAGVEIKKYLPSKIPLKTTIVILPGRMLWDKGVGEFVRVAKRIKAKNIKVRFVLVGDVDLDNPASIKQKQIDKWVETGIIEQWGRCDDMEKIYKKCSIVCLPSYNEGLPKVLLEAGSSSRPIVAFDVPGCREVIKNKVNGFLVEFRDENALETALTKLINDKKLCEEMGKKGRKMVEKHFASEIINVQTFNIWSELN